MRTSSGYNSTLNSDARQAQKLKIVITGFNTDIEHDGIVYHVQTEDKGLETPLLLSLVYSGGAILASKRSRYDDLIAEGFDETVLHERLQRQHKLICAAIRAGRLDELKEMSGREKPARGSKKKAQAKPPVEVISEPLALDEVAPVTVIPEELIPITLEIPVVEAELPLPPPPPPQAKANSSRGAPPQEKPATEKHLPPPRRHSPHAVRVHSPRSAPSEVEVDAGPTGELHLTLIEEKNYRGGDRITLRVRLSQGTERREAVYNADVTVKILGSTFRPLIIQTKTGPDGVATFIIQLPHFRSGRAAILVRATHGRHEAELRRIIQQG
jgi:hypothetical protein